MAPAVNAPDGRIPEGWPPLDSDARAQQPPTREAELLPLRTLSLHRQHRVLAPRAVHVAS